MNHVRNKGHTWVIDEHHTLPLLPPVYPPPLQSLGRERRKQQMHKLPIFSGYYCHFHPLFNCHYIMPVNDTVELHIWTGLLLNAY